MTKTLGSVPFDISKIQQGMQNAAQVAQPATSQAIQRQLPTPGAATAAPNQGSAIKQPYYSPSWETNSTKPVDTNSPGALPYMALSWANIGTTEKPKWEPDYGPGWQGYLRKIFSKLMDPAVFNPNLSYQQKQLVESTAKSNAEAFEKKYPFLKSMDEYVTGWLRAQTSFMMPTQEEAKNLGVISPTGEVNMQAITPQQLITSQLKRTPSLGLSFAGKTFGAAFDVVSKTLYMVGENPIRKMFSVNAAVDDVAESYGVIMPRQHWFGGTQRSAYADFLNGATNLWRMGKLANAHGDKIVGNAALATAVASGLTTFLAPGLTPLLRTAIVGTAIQLGGTAQDKLALERRWNSSGAIYSMLADEARYSEFKRLYDAGDMRPDLLTDKLQNPWIELGAGLVFDLTNLIMPGKDKIPAVRSALEELEKPGTEVLQQVMDHGSEIIQRGADEMASQGVFQRLVGAIDDGIQVAKEKMVRLASDYTLFAPDAEGKAAAAMGRQSRLLNAVVMQTVRNGRADEAADLMSHVIRYVSAGTEEEKLGAVAGIYNHEFGRYMLSKAGLDFMSMAKQLLTKTTEAGEEVIQKSAANRFLDDIAEHAGSVDELTKFLTDKMENVVDAIYPSIEDMKRYSVARKAGEEMTGTAAKMADRYDQLSVVYKGLNTFKESTGPVYQLYNRFFGMIYMGLSPGYAMRNMLTNTVVILADEGAPTALRSIGYALAETLPKKFGPGAWLQRRKTKLADMLGISVEEMGTVMPWATQGITAAGGEGSRFAKKGMIAVSQKFESGASLAIVEKVVRDEMNNTLRGGAMPSADFLIRKGLSEEGANLLIRKVLDYHGNIDKALDAFYKGINVQTQTVDAWRHMEVPDTWRKMMEDLHLWDEFIAMREKPENGIKQVEIFLADVLRQYKKTAGLSVRDVVAHLPDTTEAHLSSLGAEIMEDIGKSPKRMEQQEMFDQALTSFRNALDTITGGAFDWIGRMRETYGPGRLPVDKAIPNDFFDQLLKKVTGSRERLTEARDLADALRNKVRHEWIPGTKGGDLKALWESVTFNGATMGEFPKDATKHDVVEAIWQFFFEQRNKTWMEHNAKVKEDSWDAIKSLLAEIDRRGLAPPQLDDQIMKDLTMGEAAFEEGKIITQSEDFNQAANKIRMATPEDFPSYWFQQGATPQNATLNDLHPLYLRMFGWDRGKKGLMNAVNADRKVLQLPTYANPEDVPFVEAIDALRRRVVQPDDVSSSKLSAIGRTIENWTGSAVDDALNWAFRVGNTKERKLIGEVNSNIHIAQTNKADRVVLDALEKERNAVVKDIYDRITSEAQQYAAAEINPAIDAKKATEMLQAIEDEFQHAYQYSGEAMPSINRAMLENYHGFLRDTQRVYDGHLQNLEVKTTVAVDANVRKAIEEFTGAARPRIAAARSHAMVMAEQMRHFALHAYTGDKKYFDLALSMIMPYHYWYSRTYAKMLQRLVWRPAIIAAYAKYRRALEIEHAGLPDWWKYNIIINRLPGINLDNPLYFNLEATLNPMNGLTGVDFSDANKRVTWYANAVDDLGKFGPSLMTPINWLVAGALWLRGEEEFQKGKRGDAQKYYGGAQRWLGRLIPQTATIKSFLGKVGWQVPVIGGYETDPFVLLADGGYDPYERRQLTRALADMSASGQITNEQALDVAYTQKGEVWQQAARNSLSTRFVGQMMSFFMGVGFRPRTPGDLEIDKFYNDYFALVDMRDNMSPIDYQREMLKLRGKYKWMDVVLLGRKSDADRDAAYAYTVISRVPPGMSPEVFAAAGIDQSLVNKFYDDKGDFDGWRQEDINRFMGAVIDIGATMAIPQDAVKAEWIDAKDSYAQMEVQVQQQLGAEIWDKVDNYYSIYHEDRNKAADWLADNPDVQQALDLRSQYVISNPLLYKYYGGINTLRNFYNGQMYAVLDAQFPNARAEWQEYYRLQMDDALYKTKQASFYKKTHPDMVKYSEAKSQWADAIERKIIAFGDTLDNSGLAQVRSDFQPQNTYQQNIAATVTPAPIPRWEDFEKYMQPSMERLVIDYFNGAELPSNVSNELDYLAPKLGYENGDALLEAMGASYSQINR